jgi:hypothetical protein
MSLNQHAYENRCKDANSSLGYWSRLVRVEEGHRCCDPLRCIVPSRWGNKCVVEAFGQHRYDNRQYCMPRARNTSTADVLTHRRRGLGGCGSRTLHIVCIRRTARQIRTGKGDPSYISPLEEASLPKDSHAPRTTRKGENTDKNRYKYVVNFCSDLLKNSSVTYQMCHVIKHLKRNCNISTMSAMEFRFEGRSCSKARS